MPPVLRYFFASTPRRMKQVPWSEELGQWQHLRSRLMWDLGFVYQTPGGRLTAMSDITAAMECDFRRSGRAAPRLGPESEVPAYTTLVLFRVPPSDQMLEQLARTGRREGRGAADDAAGPAVDTTDMESILAGSARAWAHSSADGPQALRQGVESALRREGGVGKRPRANYVCHHCGTEGEHFGADCPRRRGEAQRGPIFRTPKGIPTYKLRRVTAEQAQGYKLVFRKADQTLWVHRDDVPEPASREAGGGNPPT